MGSPTVMAGTPRGNHLCRLVDGDDDFRAAALAYLAAGLANGERVLYVAERSAPELAADLAPLGDVDALIERGSLVLQSTSGLYEPGGSFDAGEQVARYRALTEQALADGYTGLRVAADATAFVTTPASRRQFVSYEVAVDQLMAEIPMSAMCAYDVTRVGAAAGELCAVHPEDAGSPRLRPGFRLCFGVAGLELSGEIDISNEEILATALGAAVACSPARVVIDTSGLAFIGARSLARLARLRRELHTGGRDLVLTGAPPMMRRCASLLDLDLQLDAPREAQS